MMSQGRRNELVTHLPEWLQLSPSAGKVMPVDCLGFTWTFWAKKSNCDHSVDTI